MSTVINTPNCERNLGQTIKDFMFVPSTKKQTLSKRYYERKMNASFKATEKELDQDLVNYFKEKTELKLTSMKIYHSSHLLARSLKIAKFREYANGLTLLIFNFENYPPLFFFTICNKEDNFSRLEGRVYVKRKSLHALLNKGPAGLYSYDTPKEFISSINPLKIGNWVVKHYIKPVKVKKVEPINILKYQDEEKLLAMAKEVLGTNYNLDPKSFSITNQYIRFYRTNMFAYGLVCTPEWFKNLNQEGKELISKGGYTVYALTGLHKETGEKYVAVSISICSPEEAFTKSYGRKQCLLNCIKDKVNVFSMKQEVPSMKDALLSIAEQQLQHAINVEISNKQESGLLPC